MRRYRGAGLLIFAVLMAAACSRSAPTAGDTLNVLQAAGLREWKAEPAMIANFGVYRQHEFVFQDYIHDDHGANTDGLDHVDLPFGAAGPDPGDLLNLRLSPAPIINYAGDFLYAAPSNHMADVADLLEFRVAVDAGNVYYRIRLGDMTDPDTGVVGICVNEGLNYDQGLAAWPFGAGLTEQLGCTHFYTVHAGSAWVDGAPSADPRTIDVGADLVQLGGAVSADVAEATIELRVPRSVADPGNGHWRYYVGAGLWNGTAWAAPLPIPQILGAPVVTGGRPGVPNIWDLLSNNREPNSAWNEEKQANDLTAHNILDDYVDVDFARLAEERDDPDPQLTGVIERIYRSQYPTATGRGTDIVSGVGTHFEYQGPWQPYVAVLPKSYYTNPQRLYPFDLCMHPLGANHNVEVYYAEALARPDYNPLVTGITPSSGYFGTAQITSLIDLLDGVYACTLGRGEGLGYQNTDGMVDMLEVQDDMLKRYRVDGERRTIHGVSLGALGTWYVARMYPDRYAAAMPYIFTSDLMGGTTAEPTLENLYNLPVFFSIGSLDEFGQGTQGDPAADQMEGFGNEYVYLHYLGRQHEGRIENDFLPFTLRLAYSRRLVGDPARVRFVFDPANYSAKIPGAGGAYWVSGMKQRDAASAAEIDVTSWGRADQLPSQSVVFDGIYANGAKGFLARLRGLLRMSEQEFRAMWHPEQWEPGWQELSLTVTPSDISLYIKGNSFQLSSVNLASVQLDTARMNLSGGPLHYTVQSDGPLEIHLSDGRSISFADAGAHEGDL